MAREEFEHALQSIEEVYQAGLFAFVEWAQQNWKVTPKESQVTLGETEDWQRGWNTCLEGLSGALSVFIDEINPR